MTRKPALLTSALVESERLDPVSMSVTLNLTGLSEAEITLAESAPDVKIHDWISIYTRRGFSGVYRVSNAAHMLTKQTVLTLLHGRDILSDSVWADQTEFEGTMTEYLTALLNQQTRLINGVKPWTLGTCADVTTTVNKSINYDRLSSLLEDLEDEGSDYYFTYDQSVFPWVLNYVAKDQAITSEFRLTRNVRTASVTYNDADLCTRLHLSINVKAEDEDTSVTSTDTLIKTYNNSSAQSEWGIVVKTADIDTVEDDVTSTPPVTPEADAWAAAFLARRAAPSVQIQIEGEELRGLTQEAWDEADIGRLCQVALPAYGNTFRERVISVSYPENLKSGASVVVSLANALPKFSETLAMIRDEAASTARAVRSAARSSADAKELTVWSQHVKYQGDALDGTGITTLYESGIDMDASGGVTIFSLENGLQALYSRMTVNANSISSIVSQSGIVTNKFSASTSYSAGDRVLYNGTAYKFTSAHSGAWTGADVVAISSLQSQITQNASAITLKVSEGDVATQLAVECNNVTITGTPPGGNLVVDGYVLASAVSAELAVVDNLIADGGYTGNLKVVGSLGANKIQATTIDGTTVKAETLQLTESGSTYTVGTKNVYVGSSLIPSIQVLATGSATSLDIPNAVSDLQILLNSSTNVYTLQKKTYSSSSSWTDVGTFSRATSLSGAWSGSTYTVSASPQGNTASTSVSLEIGSAWDYDDTLDKYQKTVRIKSGTRIIATDYVTKPDSVISSIAIVTGSSSSSADVDGGTLSADTYYLVTATADTGGTKKLKFKTPASGSISSSSIDVDSSSYTITASPTGTALTTLANMFLSTSASVQFRIRVIGTSASKYYYLPH